MIECLRKFVGEDEQIEDFVLENQNFEQDDEDIQVQIFVDEVLG